MKIKDAKKVQEMPLQKQENKYEESKNTNSKLAMVIIKKQNLWGLVQKIKKSSTVQKIYVLKTENNPEYDDFFFVIFDSDSMLAKTVKSTIIHKKGKAYYTINALNELVKRENNGKLDNNFPINWQKYQNKILFLNNQKQLVQINTKLYKLIRLNKYSK